MSNLQFVYLPVDALTPYEKNARRHQESDIEVIKKSIQEFGFNDPIGIWSDKNIIVEGHGRLMAAKELGITEVPCIRLDDLTDDQRKAYALAHNRSAELSEWDLDTLDDELRSLQADFDLNELGFEEFLDEPEPLEIEEDDFDIDANIPDEPKAKLGDIYQLGNHRLMCGDSTDKEDVEKLMNGIKADMVFTDPPYGMNLDTDYSKFPKDEETMKKMHIKRSGIKYEKVIGDNEDFKDELVTTIFNNFDYCNEIFVWGADYYPELLKDYKKGNFIVWDKKKNDGLESNLDNTFTSTFEICWSKKKHKKDIVRILWCGILGTEQEFDHKRYHPTQKPTKLSRWFIDKYSKENNLIVDIYGGSGSTLIACEQLNRNCYMMELDPHYIDVIIARWENYTGRKAIKIEN